MHPRNTLVSDICLVGIAIVALAVALLSGCARGSRYEVDPEFTPEEAAEIDAAVDEWPADLANRGDLYFIRGTAGDRGPPPPDGLHVAAYTEGRTIHLAPMGDPATFRRACAHEVGHTLGLGHITDRPSIMFPVMSGATDLPTAEDVEEARRHGG